MKILTISLIAFFGLPTSSVGQFDEADASIGVADLRLSAPTTQVIRFGLEAVGYETSSDCKMKEHPWCPKMNDAKTSASVGTPLPDKAETFLFVSKDEKAYSLNLMKSTDPNENFVAFQCKLNGDFAQVVNLGFAAKPTDCIPKDEAKEVSCKVEKLTVIFSGKCTHRQAFNFKDDKKNNEKFTVTIDLLGATTVASTTTAKFETSAKTAGEILTVGTDTTGSIRSIATATGVENTTTSSARFSCFSFCLLLAFLTSFFFAFNIEENY